MKVSIITPSFNQGKFIQRTLESVAASRSTLPAGVTLEHIVFDGGSNDETVSILQDFVPAVQWISQPDKGQTDAVNKGIQASNGEIIGWLNSDDIYYPEAIASVVDFFMRNPDADVVYGQADHIDINDQPFEDYPTEPWSAARLQETCFICQPALFFRRRVVDKYGLLDESLNYCMDYEYWLRLSKFGIKFAYLEKKLAGSRLYADNKTLGARVKVHHEINRMFKQKFGKAPKRWIINYAHAVVENKIHRDSWPSWFKFNIIAVSFLANIYFNHTLWIKDV